MKWSRHCRFYVYFTEFENVVGYQMEIYSCQRWSCSRMSSSSVKKMQLAQSNACIQFWLYMWRVELQFTCLDNITAVILELVNAQSDLFSQWYFPHMAMSAPT